LSERKRRELDPSLRVLDRASLQAETDPALAELKERLDALRRFFRLIDALAVRLLSMPLGDPAALGETLSDDNST
jgi:hypothetical protein